MAYDSELSDRVRTALEGHPGLTERKMFGGIAFMLNGNMCCGVINDDLMVRVGPEGFEDALAQPHARPMDFTGRPMKGFVFVGAEGTQTATTLKRWVLRGVAFAGSLPSK